MALAASFLSSVPEPQQLPDIALGWSLLFRVERAATLLAVVGAVGLITWRTSRGEMPIRIANVGYDLDQNVKVSASIEERVWLLELANGLRPRTVEDDEEGA